MSPRNIIQKRTGCKSQGSFLFTTTFFAIFSPNIYSLVVSILVSFQLLTYSVLEKAAAPAFLAARCQRQEAISHNNREHINGLSTLDNLENLEKKTYIPFEKAVIIIILLFCTMGSNQLCMSILTFRRPHFHQISHVTFEL